MNNGNIPQTSESSSFVDESVKFIINIQYVNMDICAFLLKSLICIYYVCVYVCVSLLVQKCIDYYVQP